MRFHHILAALAGLLLVACGATAVEPTAIQPTAAPSIAAPTAAPAPAGAVAASALDALPRSQTAEGYQTLGDVNAPLTLTMYSDFL